MDDVYEHLQLAEAPSFIAKHNGNTPMIASASLKSSTEDAYTAEDILPLINALNNNKNTRKTNRTPPKNVQHAIAPTMNSIN